MFWVRIVLDAVSDSWYVIRVVEFLKVIFTRYDMYEKIAFVKPAKYRKSSIRSRPLIQVYLY